MQESPLSYNQLKDALLVSQLFSGSSRGSWSLRLIISQSFRSPNWWVWKMETFQRTFFPPWRLPSIILCPVRYGTAACLVLHLCMNERIIDWEFAFSYLFQLCHMQGHICEGCRSNDILFPFQTGLVRQCNGCKACYHEPCFQNLAQAGSSCSKCQRIRERLQKRRSNEHELTDNR